MTAKDHLNSIETRIHELETAQPLSFYAVTFFAVIFLRHFLESVFESTRTIGFHTDASVSAAILMHYTVSWCGIFLGIVVILKLLTREEPEKIFRVAAVGWALTLFPPIFDFFIARKAYSIQYIGDIRDLMSVFRNLLNPFHAFGAISPGIRIEVITASLLLALYAGLKRRSFLFSLLGYLCFHAYFVFFVGGFGFLWNECLYWPARLVSPASILSRNLITVPGLIQNRESLFSVFWLIALAVFWFILFPNYWKTLVKSLKPWRGAYYALLALAGAAAGGRIAAARSLEVYRNPPLDIFAVLALCAAVFLAWQSSVIFNDMTDVAEDSVSQPERPLAKRTVEPAEYRKTGFLCLFLALALAFSVNYFSFLLLLFCLASSVVYSFPPFRLKRHFLPASLLISIAAFCSFACGAAVFLGGKAVQFIPARITVCIFTTVFLASGFMTLKDARGDRIAGNRTIPVLFGETAGKVIISIMVLASYLVVPWLLEYPSLFLPSLLFGIFSCALINCGFNQEWWFLSSFFCYFYIVFAFMKASLI